MDPSGGYQISNGSVVPPRGYALSGKIMLCALVALFAVVLLVVFLHLYLRYRLLRLASQRRRRRRLRSRRLTFAAVDASAAVAGGLDPAALKFLPIIVISGEESECAVCLCEFEEGEKVRGLPRCGHHFHIECIDMWFHSHATCPLCRSPVEPTPPPPPLPPPPPPMLGGAGSSSGGGDLRVEVLGLGFGSPSWMKSPGGRMSAIRRILSWDRRRVGEEQDLERGEATDLDPPPTLPPPPPSALPAAELR